MNLSKWIFLVNLSCIFCSIIACGNDSSSGANQNDVDERLNSSSSSSFEPPVKPCKTKTKDECEYGTLKDERDGQTYRTVKIGNRWWMAENLNYEYLLSENSLDTLSSCYNDSLSYCEKYGRLYRWSAAMDSAAIFSSDGEGCGDERLCKPKYPLRGVCPKGWSLPTTLEWNKMFVAVGGYQTAALMLKADSGWFNGGEGLDAYGFSLLPAGFATKTAENFYTRIGDYTIFWSSIEIDKFHSSFLSFSRYDDTAWGDDHTVMNGKNARHSVRCIKND